MYAFPFPCWAADNDTPNIRESPRSKAPRSHRTELPVSYVSPAWRASCSGWTHGAWKAPFPFRSPSSPVAASLVNPIRVFPFHWLPSKAVSAFPEAHPFGFAQGLLPPPPFSIRSFSAEATLEALQLTPGVAAWLPLTSNTIFLRLHLPQDRLCIDSGNFHSKAVSVSTASLLSCIHQSNLEMGAQGLTSGVINLFKDNTI